MTAALDGSRALHWLHRLAERAAAAARDSAAEADPLQLAAALGSAAGTEALVMPLELAPDDVMAQALAARVAGREGGAPWLICAPTLQPWPGQSRWRPNADGSGVALLLALLERLREHPPEHDVLALLLPVRGERDDGLAAAEAYAARPLLNLRGVVALWQMGVPGAPLELDARSLLNPVARALADELFRLGRTLGYPAWSGGAQSAFPGAHVPFLERGLAAVPLCALAEADAGRADDTLERCDGAALQGVGDPLLRFLCGERAV